MVTVVITLFKANPTPEWMPLIVSIAGSEHRTKINWHDFYQQVSKKNPEVLYLTSFWSKRSETFFMAEKMSKQNSRTYALTMPPFTKSLRLGAWSIPLLIRDLADQPYFDLPRLYAWIRHLELPVVRIITGFLLECYARYENIRSLQQAKALVAMAHPPVSELLVDPRKPPYSWPGYEEGHTLCCPTPSSEVIQRYEAWNDWVRQL